MAELIHKCMTKATIAKGKEIRRSWNWVTSRRGTLNVMSDALELGDWRIPYDEIDEAVLFSIRQMFIPCYVLCVVSKGKTYQFGLNPGSYWKGDLPFSVEREKTKVSHSWYSIVVRIVLVLLVVRWLIRLWR